MSLASGMKTFLAASGSLGASCAVLSELRGRKQPPSNPPQRDRQAWGLSSKSHTVLSIMGYFHPAFMAGYLSSRSGLKQYNAQELESPTRATCGPSLFDL